jgi:hypothetical protein
MPLTQRKIITMDYEEYIKLEKYTSAFRVVVDDIMNAKSIEDLREKYAIMLDKINNTK